MILLPLFVMLILVAINALYVAAEFAAVSVSRPRLQQFADEGNITARRLLPVVADSTSLDRYVAACQIGITVSSLVTGAYAQIVFSPVVVPLLMKHSDLDEIAAQGMTAAGILVGLTAFQMILGELLPKSLALQFPTAVILKTSGPMFLSLKVLSPFIQFLNGSSALLLRLFRVRQTSHRHVHSAEEMGMLFSNSLQGGHLESNEHERLTQALQLGDRKVTEIMVPRNEIKSLDIDADYETILREMDEHPYTRWPVYEGDEDNIIGIVHARDVAKLALDASKKFQLRKVVRVPLVIHEAMTAEDLLAVMRIEHQQIAIVVDEYGVPVGLAGISDVLDELMGDIHEGESVEEGDEVEVLTDGRVRIPGKLRLVDAEKWIGREWKSDHAVTVAGKILEELGTLPEVGDVFTIDGTSGEIDRVSVRTIESVLILPFKREVLEASSE